MEYMENIEVMSGVICPRGIDFFVATFSTALLFGGTGWGR
jgi:hypothetical protein